MAKRPRTCPALEAFAWLAQAAEHLAVVQGLGWLMEGAQSWWVDLPEDHLLEHYLWVELPVARQLVVSLAGSSCQYRLVSYASSWYTWATHIIIGWQMWMLYVVGGVALCKDAVKLQVVGSSENFRSKVLGLKSYCICNLQLSQGLECWSHSRLLHYRRDIGSTLVFALIQEFVPERKQQVHNFQDIGWATQSQNSARRHNRCPVQLSVWFCNIILTLLCQALMRESHYLQNSSGRNRHNLIACDDWMWWDNWGNRLNRSFNLGRFADELFQVLLLLIWTRPEV